MYIHTKFCILSRGSWTLWIHLSNPCGASETSMSADRCRRQAGKGTATSLALPSARGHHLHSVRWRKHPHPTKVLRELGKVIVGTLGHCRSVPRFQWTACPTAGTHSTSMQVGTVVRMYLIGTFSFLLPSPSSAHFLGALLRAHLFQGAFSNCLNQQSLAPQSS